MISVVIPARNEEESVITTLETLREKVTVPYEIIVVNDGSTDSTEAVVKRYAKTNKKVKLVNNLGPKGFASALKLGIKIARGDYLVPIMADLCDDAATINKMYKKILEDWDIVCGSRYMKGGKKVGGPKLQGLLSEFVCRSLRIFTNISTWDVSNSFKMYRRQIIDSLKFNKKSGVEASMELLFQAYFGGAKIIEIPTTWRGRSFGRSKFKLLSRTPRYLGIYLWTVENSLRKTIGLQLKPFYQ